MIVCDEGTAPPVARGRHRGPRQTTVHWVFVAVRRLLALAICCAVILLAFGTISGNWELLPVLSGSMSPGMPTGSIAIAQREPIGDLRLHDVAVFHPPGSPRVIYIHRVISLERLHGELLVRTKGDANPVPDPWTLHITSRSVYIVRYRIPHIGYVVLWVHSKAGRETILMVAGLLALGLVVSSFRDKRGHERKGSEKDVTFVCDITNTGEVIDIRDRSELSKELTSSISSDT